MNEETQLIQTPSIEDELAHLSQLAEQIRRNLPEADLPDLDEICEELDLIVASLKRLRRQVSSLEEEREDLLALARISQVINSSLDLDDVLRIVMDTIVRLTGAERGFLVLIDQQGTPIIRIARNWEKETIEEGDSAISLTVVRRVLEDGTPVLTTNAREDPRFDNQESVIALNLRSILCVPLKSKGEIIGAIYADNRVRTGLFTESEKKILTAFANQAAVAIENARLFESLRQTLSEVVELKNLMDDVFTSIASGVITTDLDDRIVMANRAAEVIFGLSRQDLLNKRIDEIPLLDELNILRHISGVRQDNRQIVALQTSATSPTRGALTLRFNLSPLLNGNGQAHGVAIVVDDITETRRLEAQRRLFERMVSPQVINQLDPDQLDLGGTRTEITTLFADLRGFTSLSERHPPETLVSLLNRYLGAATEAILEEEGTIDKFMGDAIMAFFNAPIPQRDHILRAARAAAKITRSANTIRMELSPEFQLSWGIGIHTGEAVLGLVGTQRRLEYTAIGDSVNIAKRLQENAGEMQILISAQVYEAIKDHVSARKVASVVVRGRTEPVQVYELTGFIRS